MLVVVYGEQTLRSGEHSLKETRRTSGNTSILGEKQAVTYGVDSKRSLTRQREQRRREKKEGRSLHEASELK